MKISKKLFDYIFISIAVITMVIFSEFNFWENMSYSLIPILIAYYLGQYSMKLTK
jgi:hypothetical protein